MIEPLEKNVQPFTIPVVCYRAMSRDERNRILKSMEEKGEENDGESISLLLKPERFSLGVIAAGSEKSFQLSGAEEWIRECKKFSTKGFPQGVTVEMSSNPSVEGGQSITVQVGEHVANGLIDGMILIPLPERNEYVMNGTVAV